MRRYVLQSGQNQRIKVNAMLVVARKRATHAIFYIVAAAWKAVINETHRAVFAESFGER